MIPTSRTDYRKIGKQGRLTPIALFYEGGSEQWTVLCSCDCGTILDVKRHVMLRGNTRSCGCLRRDVVSKRRTTHGEGWNGGKRSPEYRAWIGLRQRCVTKDPRVSMYYSARGIKVCERWNSYENFLADMGRRPTPKHSIDRYPDPNGNYEPSNCRWATWHEQRMNQNPKGTFKQ